MVNIYIDSSAVAVLWNFFTVLGQVSFMSRIHTTLNKRKGSDAFYPNCK